MRSSAAHVRSARTTIRSGAEPLSQPQSRAQESWCKSRADMTRILVIAGTVVAATLLGGWGWDRPAPYCLYDRDFTSCTYPTFAACLASASGAGGYCAENPRYVAPPPPPTSRRPRAG